MVDGKKEKAMISEKEKNKIDIFVERVKEILGEKLVSVIVYGSILKESYIPKKSDINIVVIVEGLDVSDLLKIKNKLARFSFRHLIKPFFFTIDFLKSSTDVFPVEWKEIKENHLVVYGKDILEEIILKKQDIRLQLERDIKQNFINFNQGIIFREDLSTLIEESLKSLQIFLRNAKEIITEEIEKPSYIEELEKCLREKRKITKAQTKKIMQEHLNFLEKLIKLIDREGGKNE
ncbi:MAG: hypothetical protein NC915_06110 [Candidatus Omnitrophica bacterium]|nr:hypothetical protein [Candidatus Omnitrophota bacterium]